MDYNSENVVHRTSVAQLLFTEVPVPGQGMDPTDTDTDTDIFIN